MTILFSLLRRVSAIAWFIRPCVATISALIPWNSCGAYMAATLGVATVSFAPFAFFNYINPIVTIVFAAFGWRMLSSPQTPEGDVSSEAPGDEADS